MKNKTVFRRSGKCASICIVLMLVIGLLAGCGGVKLEDGFLMEGVFVAGVDVGGMAKEDALRVVQMEVGDSYSTTPMVIHIGGETIELTPELTGISFHAEAAIEAAYALGREGTAAERKEQQLAAMTTGLHADIIECLTLDTDTVYAALGKLCEGFTGELTQTSYEVKGELPDLFVAEEPAENQVLAVTIGSPAFDFDLDLLYAQVLDAYQAREFEIEYQCEMTEPDPLDLDAVYAEVCLEPVDAVIDQETYEISAHSYGYVFDLEAAKAELEAANYGDVLEFPFTRVAPAQTTEALSELLFRDELASFSAYQGSSNARATNLRLACEALNGTILNPGEVFDYNTCLGERTAERGYLPAASYVGGETVDTYGGGICQPSSVLYYCVLLADLEVVTRTCHMYISSYIDPGMDATVSWGGPEFRFRNNTEYPIRIDASASGGTVNISLVGTDTKDYYVKMEYKVLDTYGWTTEYEDYSPNNSKGYKDGDVITTPYTGYAVQTYKCKYSKEDDSLISREKEAYSVYSSRNKKVARVEEEEEETEPTEPEETTPPTTEPPTTEPPTTTVPPTEPEVTNPPETNPPETNPPEPDPGNGGVGDSG